MLRQTAHPTESRYEILGLFTVSMIASSFIVVASGTLLPYMARAFPAHRSDCSMIVAALLLGAALTNALSGAATDRFGDKAVLIVCGIIMGLSLIAAAAIESFEWILFWFVVYGMGFAAMTPVGSHAILFFFKPEERGLAMGVRQMGVPLGGVGGGILIATAAEYYGYRGSLLVIGIAVLVITLGCAALYREPSALHGQPVRAGVLLKDIVSIGRDLRLLLITATSIILFAVQIGLMGFFPWTLVNAAHMSAGLASVVFVISQFAGAAGRVAWGWISDRVFRGNRLIPLAITCVLCALAAIGVARVASMPLPAVAGVAIALGFAAEGWFGLAVIAMAEVGGEQHAGSALGFGMTWVMLSGVFVPGIFQGIMQGSGIPAAWNVLAIVALAGIVPTAVAIALARRKATTVSKAA